MKLNFPDSPCCPLQAIMHLKVWERLNVQWPYRLTLHETTKLIKSFADNKINVNFVMGGVENIVGKGENAGNQHFLLSPQCF